MCPIRPKSRVQGRIQLKLFQEIIAATNSEIKPLRLIHCKLSTSGAKKTSAMQDRNIYNPDMHPTPLLKEKKITRELGIQNNANAEC